jgi:hypothetical protein
MAWQYDVDFEGVKVDIEFTHDQDIESGEWYYEIESVEIDGNDVAPLIYAVDDKKAEQMLVAALTKAIQDEAKQLKLEREEAKAENLSVGRFHAWAGLWPADREAA